MGKLLLDDVHRPQNAAAVLDLDAEALGVDGFIGGKLNGKGQTFFRHFYPVILLPVEKINAVFAEVEVPVLKIMLCIAGKLYADDVMLAVFCGKFYGRKVENFVDFARGRCGSGCFLA